MAMIRRDAGWSFLALVALAATLCAGFSLTVLRDLKNAWIAGASSPAMLLHDVRPSGWLLGLAAVLSIAALAVAERRHGTGSRFLREMSPRQALALTLLLSAALGHAYLFPGRLLGGDTGAHIARIAALRAGLAAGRLPLWSNDSYIGSDLLGYTGPLFFLVAGALDLIARDPYFTVKLILFASHVLSAGLMFGLLRRLGYTAAAATFGAVGYAGCFAQLHLFLYRGVLPQALTIPLLLLAFLAAERLAARPRLFTPAWAGLALAVGGLVLNHQPHALFALCYLGLFGLASCAVRRWPVWALPQVACASACGLLIGAVAIFPVLAEARQAMIAPGGLPGFRLAPLADWVTLLAWRATLSNHGAGSWAYLGVVWAGLAGLGAASLWLAGRAHPRLRAALAALPCLLASLFVTDANVRDIIFILLFVAPYAAEGAEAVLAWRPGGAVPAVALSLLCLDLASTSAQPVAREDKAFLPAAGAHLGAAPGERVLEVWVGRDGTLRADLGPDGGIAPEWPVRRLAGAHNMAATRAHNYLLAAADMAASDLTRRGRLSAETRAVLAMLNVTRIVCPGPAGLGCPASVRDAEPEGPLGRRLAVPGAAPVLFGRALVPLDPAPDLDKPMLWAEDFAAGGPTVAALEALLRRVAAGAPAPGTLAVAELPVRGAAVPAPPADGTPWSPRLLSYEVTGDAVRLRVETSQPCWVQLAHPFFPWLEARIGGRAVRPRQGTMNLMLLQLAPGVSDIELAYRPSALRRASAVLSGTALLVLLMATGSAGFARAVLRRSGGDRAPPGGGPEAAGMVGAAGIEPATPAV